MCDLYTRYRICTDFHFRLNRDIILTSFGYKDTDGVMITSVCRCGVDGGIEYSVVDSITRDVIVAMYYTKVFEKIFNTSNSGKIFYIKKMLELFKMLKSGTII